MKNKNLVFSLFVALTTLVACNDTDDATGKSVLPVSNDVITSVVTDFSTSADNVVNEDDEDVFTMSVTLNKTQPVDIYLNVESMGGTAVLGADYELSRIFVPANTLTGTGTISILNDEISEIAETFSVRIANQPANVSVTSKTATFTINNFLSDELHLDFKYNKSIQFGGAGGVTTTSTLCGILYDLDFYLLDASLADTGDYQAASANCEESMVLDATLADGTYFVIPDLYDGGDVNGGTNAANDGINSIYHLPFKVQLGIDFSKEGGINPGSFAVRETLHPLSTNTPAQYAAIAQPILKIEKSTVSGKVKFVLSNPDTSEVIASGRFSKNLISDKINKARKNNLNKR